MRRSVYLKTFLAISRCSRALSVGTWICFAFLLSRLSTEFTFLAEIIIISSTQTFTMILDWPVCAHKSRQLSWERKSEKLQNDRYSRSIRVRLDFLLIASPHMMAIALILNNSPALMPALISSTLICNSPREVQALRPFRAQHTWILRRFLHVHRSHIDMKREKE